MCFFIFSPFVPVWLRIVMIGKKNALAATFGCHFANYIAF